MNASRQFDPAEHRETLQRLTLTVEEAAEMLGISRALAYEALSRGEIPHLRIGRRILVPTVAITHLLQTAEAPESHAQQGLYDASQTSNEQPTPTPRGVERGHILAAPRPIVRR